jgi:hypothetical protein
MTPGAVIKIAQASAGQVDVTWLGNLKDCGVPDSAVNVEQAATPNFTGSGDYSLDANVTASIVKFNASAGAKIGSTSAVTIKAASDEFIDFLQFHAWYAIPSNAQQFNTLCGQITLGSGVYVVQEAFVVTDGSVSVKDNANANVSLTPSANSIFKAGIDASGNSTGELTISKPAVFAIKRLQQTSATTWATLGQPAQAESDSPDILSGQTLNASNLK